MFGDSHFCISQFLRVASSWKADNFKSRNFSRYADVLLSTETRFVSNVPRVVFIDDKPTTISRADRPLANRGSVAIFANDRCKATIFL